MKTIFTPRRGTTAPAAAMLSAPSAGGQPGISTWPVRSTMHTVTQMPAVTPCPPPLQAGSQIAGPGCHALAKMLTRNTSLRQLSIFWTGADHTALDALATALSSNTTLTSLALGDPRSLSAEQTAQAASAILSSASPQLRRLTLSYVTIPSAAHAQRVCGALRSNQGVEELCLPYLSIKYSSSQPDQSAEEQDCSGEDGNGLGGLEDRAEAGGAALLGAALRSRGPSLRALELPFMHVRSTRGAHAAVLAEALTGATALAKLDILQVRTWPGVERCRTSASRMPPYLP